MGVNLKRWISLLFCLLILSGTTVSVTLYAQSTPSNNSGEGNSGDSNTAQQIFLPFLQGGSDDQNSELSLTQGDQFVAEQAFATHLLEIEALLASFVATPQASAVMQVDQSLLDTAIATLIELNNALRRRFAEREQKLVADGLPSVILERHRETVEQHVTQVTALLAHLNEIRTMTDVDQARAKIEETLLALHPVQVSSTPDVTAPDDLPVQPIKRKAPIRNLNEVLSVAEVAEGVVAAGVPSGAPVAADLSATIDVQFTAEVTAQAAGLHDSPLEIYQFVRDNFDFEPYLGSRKGSRETLLIGSGNDYDLATLLIALLRVSGTPARYVSGTILVPIEQVKNWLGIEDAGTAGDLLATAGYEATSYIDGGGQISAIGFKHVWVAAYVPYTNYRGIPNDNDGSMWIPLDPSFKSFTYTAATDIPAAQGFSAESYVDSYVTTLHTASPVELYLEQIEDYVTINRPDLVYPDDVFRLRTINADTLGLLPASLPYKLLAQESDYAEIPANKRHQIRFELTNQFGSSLLNYTAKLPEIASKRVTISYEAATAADQATIDSFGDLYQTPPNLINLRPVLKIDGVTVATGGTIGAGVSHNSNMYFLTPSGESNVVPAIFNNITAGTYQGIGIDTFRVGMGIFIPTADGGVPDTDALTGEKLYRTAMGYLNRVDQADEAVEQTMQVVATRSVSEAIVENVILVSTSFGTPIAWEWRGLIVDADRKIVGPFSVDGTSGEDKQFMLLTGADGSFSENRIFEDTYGEEAVSTIKILSLASDAGIAICRITFSIAAECPGYAHGSSVTSAINSALAQGREVTIPAAPITYFDWTGTGYINMEPATGAAGYIISGGQNGGATVDSWTSFWVFIFSVFRDLCSTNPITANITAPAASSYWPVQKGFFVFSLHPVFEVTYTICYDGGGTRNVDETYRPHFPYPAGDYTFHAGWGTGATRNFTMFDVKVETPDDIYAPKDGDPIPLKANVIPRVPPGATISWSKKSGSGEGTFGAPSAVDTDFTGTTAGDMDVQVEVSNANGAVEAEEELTVFGVEIEMDSDKYMGKGYTTPLAADPEKAEIKYTIEPGGFLGFGSFSPKEVKLIISKGGTDIKTETLSNSSGSQTFQWDGKDDGGAYVDADAYKIKIEVTAPNNKKLESDEGDFNVVEVTKVEFLDSSGSVISDANNHPTHSGGLRVFPGKPTASGSVNNKTKVRVTLSTNVPAGELNVYLKSYDVADPTGLIDDNHGSFFGTPAEGELSQEDPATDGDNTIEVDFTVTMQPGDNFKVFASINEELISNLSDATVETNTNAMGATTDADLMPLASERLTVWRKLHIERDSMAAVSSASASELNTLQGNIVTINQAASSATTDVSLRDGSNDLNSSPVRNGRFENGELTIAGKPGFAVTSNGQMFVDITGGLQVPFTVRDSGSTTTISGDVINLVQSAGNSQVTVSSALSPGIFAGGNLTIDGSSYSVITNTATTIDVSGAVQIAFTLVDDDATADPPAPDTSHLLGTNNRFAYAYVEPVVTDDNQNVTFIRNSLFSSLTGDYDWDTQSDEADDYWLIYLLGAFQFESDSDADPNFEGSTYGVVDALNGDGANIFAETYRDSPPTAVAGYGLPSTVAHEIGHLFNGVHAHDGIMCSFANNSSGACTKSTFFGDDTLTVIREISRP